MCVVDEEDIHAFEAGKKKKKKFTSMLEEKIVYFPCKVPHESTKVMKSRTTAAQSPLSDGLHGSALFLHISLSADRHKVVKIIKFDFCVQSLQPRRHAHSFLEICGAGGQD